MSKKIAIIGTRGYPSNFPGSSGIDSFIELYLKNDTKNDYTIYTRSWVKKIKNKKYNNIKTKSIFCINNKIFDTSLYSISATIKAIFSDVDTIWFHAPSSTILISLAKLFNKETIFTYHGIDWQRKKWKNPILKNILKILEKNAIHNSDIIQTVSLDLQKYIKNNYNKKSQIIKIEIKKYNKIDKEKSKLILLKYKLKKKKYILYLGRLVPEKQVEWLINYFNSNNINNFKLVIAGQINLSDQYTKKLIKESINNKNIIFTDYISGDEKEIILKNCYVFVNPSNIEGNSISLLEAIFHKKLCFISNLKNHIELYKENKNIYLFKNNSYLDFTKKLNKHLTN